MKEAIHGGRSNHTHNQAGFCCSGNGAHRMRLETRDAFPGPVFRNIIGHPSSTPERNVKWFEFADNIKMLTVQDEISC